MCIFPGRKKKNEESSEDIRRDFFLDLADFAEEELLHGETVITDQGVFSVEAAKGVDLESDVELEATDS